MNRVETGIKGMDNLFADGIPRSSNVLVFGKAGTGKTIMGLEFVYNGADKFNEKGLYVSLEQTEEDLIDQGNRFGWKLEKQIKEGKVKLIHYKISDIDRDFANNIIREAKKFKAKRLVIDNLALLSMSPAFSSGINQFSLLYNDKVISANDLMQFIYNLIHLLNETKTTTFYLTTTNDGKYESKDGVSEYICDGMIHLRTRVLGKSFLRTIEIVKMRKSDIVGGIYSFKITNEGVVVEK